MNGEKRKRGGIEWPAAEEKEAEMFLAAATISGYVSARNVGDGDRRRSQPLT